MLARSYTFCGGLLAFAAASGCSAFAQTTAPSAPLWPNPSVRPPWGRIVAPPNSTGPIRLEVRQWPVDGKLALPAPCPNITAAHLAEGRQRLPLAMVFNTDATQVYLEIPPRSGTRLPALILLETAEKSMQFADGRIVFSALDAKVHGDHARLESQAGNHRIGFWRDPSDSVSWDFKPTRWGMYDVEITFSADGGEGTELKFVIAGQVFTMTRPPTGSWSRYQTMPVGRGYIAKAEPFTVRASCQKLKGQAAMNLKAVTLRPAPEGQPVTQEGSGRITLHARDAITHGVMMRYEPATNKNCLGYWVNPNDWAEWEFTVSRPGPFEVEVWQGCGKGQGGSAVAVEIQLAHQTSGDISKTDTNDAGDLRSAGSPNPTGGSPVLPGRGVRLDFVVEETGHFQNFVPRKLGRIHLDQPGAYSMAVRPQHKQAGAVMDIQQVRLLPVALGP